MESFIAGHLLGVVLTSCCLLYFWKDYDEEYKITGIIIITAVQLVLQFGLLLGRVV